MKVLFLATPDFATKFLDKLRQNHDIVLVITRCDASSGRGQKYKPSPVKSYCIKEGIKVLSLENPDEIISVVKELNPDIAVTVAYGRILSKAFFSLPKYGTLNVHFSLLPKYRGAAPIQWSLINGEKITGVTVFEIDEGTDSGPVYKQSQITIDPQDDARTLTGKLVSLGIGVLEETLCEIKNGTAKKFPQQATPTYARALTKKDALLSFDETPEKIHNKIRGLAMGPYPYIISKIGNKKMRLLVLAGELCKICDEGLKPGTITSIERNLGFLVQCTGGSVLIKKVRLEGKKTVSAYDFAKGYGLKAGYNLLWS